MDIYLGQKHVGVVTGPASTDIGWHLGHDQCDMRVEGDNHEFDAQEGIGPVYDVCDVSPTRWDYHHLFPGSTRRGYAIRKNASTWIVFGSTDRAVATRKIGYVRITSRPRCPVAFLASPAGAFGLLMSWPNDLDCLT